MNHAAMQWANEFIGLNILTHPEADILRLLAWEADDQWICKPPQDWLCDHTGQTTEQVSQTITLFLQWNCIKPTQHDDQWLLGDADFATVKNRLIDRLRNITYIRQPIQDTNRSRR